MLCIAKNNSEYVEVTPVAVVKDSQVKELIGRTLTEISNSDVTVIGDYAFYYYTNLKSVYFPNVTSIGTSAFSYTSAEINFGENPKLLSIGGSAFRNYKGANLTIPNSVTSIYYSAFADISCLTYVDNENITVLYGSTFYNCSNLISVNLPKVTTITGGQCLASCKKLVSVNLPLANKIDYSSFESCSSLTDINISSATDIGQNSFRNCTSLKKIKLPSVTKFAGYYEFANCPNLEIIDMSGVSRIPTLTSSYMFGTATSISRKFIVPDALRDSWITATNWNKLYAIGGQFIKKSEYTEA